MDIEQKIIYYQRKQCIPFIELHHTVSTVCEWAKPIYPDISPLKYFEYFFIEIDFDKIENFTIEDVELKNTLKYCNAIYFGLEQLLKADINAKINSFQQKASTLTNEQILQVSSTLVSLIGGLKIQSKGIGTNESFTKYFSLLVAQIKTEKYIQNIDYQLLIKKFNETILDLLLSGYKIINSSINKIRLLRKETIAFENKNLTSSGNQPTIVDKNVGKEPTKKELLIAELSKYSFFELPKVKPLLEQSKQSLIELISTNGLPYSIAMFEYLDFLRHLETEHFTTKYKLNREVAKWFNSAKDGRAIKGNISSLSPNSTERTKARYTAYKHKEKVENDYQQLK